jgi:hypothetical protein
LTHSSAIFPIASRIRRALATRLSRTDNEKFLALKSQLPTCVQILIWKDQTTIQNGAHPNEVLLASEIHEADIGRDVYSEIPSGESNDRLQWIFSTDNDGETFSIKNIFANELLYPSQKNDQESTTVLDRQLSNQTDAKPPTEVSLWHPDSLQPNSFWLIEIVGDSEIKIKSLADGEYLYAAEKSLGSGKDRRVVQAGMRGNSCDRSCNWILKV